MTIDTLKNFLTAEPFRPFRVVTTSGRDYPVQNPSLVVMQESQLIYCYPKSDDFAVLRLNQITALETFQSA